MIKPKLKNNIMMNSINQVSEYTNMEFNKEKVINNIENTQFDGCIFKNIDFSEVKVVCKSISDCIFENCIIPNLVVTEYMGRCIFNNCKLVGLKINELIKTANILFEECDLSFSVLADGFLENITIRNTSMKEASFFNLKHKNLLMENVNLSSSEFYNFKFMNLDLSTCELYGIKFNAADLYGIIISINQLMDISGQLGIVLK